MSLLACLPLVGDAYLLKVATEILVFALFAFSLQLLIGVGGLVSFGHAAFFGLGAYGAALAVKWLGAPMEAALPLGLLLGGLGRGAYRRLRGAPLRHLSGHDDARGGADPVRGRLPMGRRDRRRQRHRRRLAVDLGCAGRSAYYLLTLALTTITVLLLKQVIDAPFGYALRAARDSEPRAEAIGIAVRQQRWLAFMLAGAGAGIAGSLYAFSRGSVDPSLLGIPTSVDALTMLLLGGIQTISGPLVGLRRAAHPARPDHAPDVPVAAGSRA